jgi:hypothetical protein
VDSARMSFRVAISLTTHDPRAESGRALAQIATPAAWPDEVLGTP